MKEISRAAGAVTVLTLAFTAASPNVTAAQGRWTQGYGQGDLEYFIDAGGVRLHIACPTEEGSADSPSRVTLLKSDSSAEFGAFKISVAGRVYQGPIEADSRVGTNNFTSLLSDLRKGDAVITLGARTIQVPKSNVASVVPVYGKKGFKCNVD